MSFGTWFQLGLPLGNTLLIVAILDAVILAVNMLKDFGIVMYFSFVIKDLEIGTPELVFLCTLPTVKLVSSIAFLWIGTILLGNNKMLLCWIVSTVLFSLAIAVNIIIESIKEIYTVYIYILITMTIFYSYQVAVGIVAFRAMKRGEVLHPIGKGLLYIWEYFSNDLHTAAKFFLVSELVIDSYFLITRQFLKDIFGIVLWGHEGDNFPTLVAEQLIMRCIRVVINAGGLALVFKEQRRLFRFWCALKFLLIVASTCIFIVLTILWRGENLASTIGLMLLFPADLLYRCVTLYFCLRYTRVNFSTMVL